MPLDFDSGLLVGFDATGIFFDPSGKPLLAYQDLLDRHQKMFGEPLENPMEAGSILAALGSSESRFWAQCRPDGSYQTLFGIGSPWMWEKSFIELSLLKDTVTHDIQKLGLVLRLGIDPRYLTFKVWPVSYHG